MIPAVDPWTRTIWDRLPEYWRTDDERLGYPLLRWLDLVCAPAGPALELINTLSRADHDVLVEQADWLDWITQTIGLTTPATATVPAKRAAITSMAASLPTRGAIGPIVAAAKAHLTGDRRVRVFRTPHHVTIHTRPSQTPDSSLVVSSMEPHRPAGVVLSHIADVGPWVDLADQAFTASAGTWADLAQTVDPPIYGESIYGDHVYGGAPEPWSFFSTWET